MTARARIADGHGNAWHDGTFSLLPTVFVCAALTVAVHYPGHLSFDSIIY